MRKIERTYGVVFVTAAGNERRPIVSYPQLASGAMSGMLVVQASGKDGQPYVDNDFGSVVNVMAPGVSLPMPAAPFNDESTTGTSFGKLHLIYKDVYA